ncbi:hypothetical protein Tco_0918960 [Tanacetum coccineum]
MERGFLSQNGRGVGTGVKEKHDTMVVESVEDVPPIVEPVATEVQSPLMDKTNAVNTGGGSYLPLPTKGTTPPGNTPVVLVESIRAVSDRFANSAYGFFLGKRVAYPVVANYLGTRGAGLSVIVLKLGTPILLDSYTADLCLHLGKVSSYARVIFEYGADVELKDTIVVAMPKVNGEGFYMCGVSQKSRLGAGAVSEEERSLVKILKGIPVGPKMTFKPNQEYRHVPKKHNANSSGNKNKGVDSTNKVSDSNPFEVLNSVDNDEDMAEISATCRVMSVSGDHDSEDEAASVDNDMTRSLASERIGFGTQSLLEQ